MVKYISDGHIQKNESIEMHQGIGKNESNESNGIENKEIVKNGDDVIDREDVRLKIRDSIRFLSGNAFAANVEDVYSKMIWSNRLYEKTIRMAGQA